MDELCDKKLKKVLTDSNKRLIQLVLRERRKSKDGKKKTGCDYGDSYDYCNVLSGCGESVS